MMPQRPSFLAVGNDREFAYRLSKVTDGYPELVSVASDDAAVVLFQGYLHYTEDLPMPLPDSTTSSEIVLAVYRQAGSEGLRQLEGEYCFVVWDKVTRRLLAQRDPFGGWPLYWSEMGSSFLIGTNLDSLSRYLPDRRIENEYLAEYLTQPFSTVEIARETTIFAGVYRVLPGTSMEFTGGRRGNANRFWDWDARIQCLPEEKTVADAGARFGQLLRGAIEQRLRGGSAAAHLSGGMDSTSVACIARDCVERAGERLVTLSQIYEIPGLASEKKYIDLFLAQGGPIDSHLLPGHEALSFSWFDSEIPEHDEPFGGLRGLASQRMLNDAAVASGARTVLTGLGSDEILESAPFHIADLLRKGRVLAAVKEAGCWAQAFNVNVWTILQSCGFEFLMPIAAREGLWPRLHSGYGRWPSLGWFTVPPWVQRDFSRRFQLWDRGLENSRRMNASPVPRSMEKQMLATTVGDWSRWYLAAPFGVNVAHPFRDPRVVSYALNIPFQLRAIPGRAKPVLQEAMQGMLPEAIRTRLGKRGFDDVYGLGLRRNLEALENMVVQSRISELGLFDAQELVQVLHSAANGTGDSLARERIDKSLALIAWFQRFVNTRSDAKPLTPNEILREPAAHGFES